jgi:DNA-binding NarL/FixJ family response regulator
MGPPRSLSVDLFSTDELVNPAAFSRAYRLNIPHCLALHIVDHRNSHPVGVTRGYQVLHTTLASQPVTSASSLANMALQRILLVEDYEPFRQLICRELCQRLEFQVIGQASDGLQAVQQAESLQPDLILLDIGLPKLNGLEAARQIRGHAPGAKLLFVSQESSPDIVRETLRLGGRGFVHKARAKTDLLPAIDAVLGGKRFVSSSLDFSENTDSETPCRHEILFCSNDDVLLQTLADFIAAALNSYCAAIVWLMESHRDALLRRLSERRVDVETAIQRGTFIVSDAAEIFDAVRILETINGLSKAASRQGTQNPRVAVCGERAGRLWVEGKLDLAMQIEQFCNELARTRHDVDILCPYPSPFGKGDDQGLKSICAEHTAVNSR